MKRTRSQKVKASKAHVNSQLTYQFHKTYNLSLEKESASYTDSFNDLGSIKKELLKSLILASLILVSLVVIYWFS